MRIKCLIIFLLFVNILSAQDVQYPQYPNPVKIPVYLSATFAELRTNAFHAGVDIKTQGKEGIEVFAVANGYISRISVSPYGYGKVVYITHDDGYTTVYAHLSKFNQNIANYVKAKQYKDKSFSQNILLNKDEFPIKKGDFIGFSGNSGGSGGPHLHYEIRNTKTQEPVNPLFFGLKIKDSQKPTIKGISIYPLENSVLNDDDKPLYLDVKNNSGNFYLENGTFFANGTFAFGINTYDQADGSANKNGVFSLELYADDSLIFAMKSDKYSYDETRYINSLIDYSHYVKEKERYVRTEIDKFNKLKLYDIRNGKKNIKLGDTVQMKFCVKDYAGNTSIVKFKMIGTEAKVIQKPILPRSYYRVYDGEPSEINLDGFNAAIPAQAFYTDVALKAVQSDSIKDICSDYAYQLGTEEIPLHKKITLKLRPSEKYKNDTLIYVAMRNSDGDNVFLRNKIADDFLEAKTNVLGIYVIARDSVSPVIKPLNFKDGASVADNWSLQVEIDDEDSGIMKYDMYINDEWVLADYDAKNKLLYYQIDNNLKKGTNNLKVVVSDMLGNKTIYSAAIQR